MRKELVEIFVMHPDWPEMVEFIEGHFGGSTDIHSVDTSKPATTIVGEVIATQKIATDLKSLKASFETLKANHNKTKPRYD